MATSTTPGFTYTSDRTINGHAVALRWIPSKQLAPANAPYQRERSDTRTARIRDSFDYRMYDPILVAVLPDGTLQVLDGNHRATGWITSSDTPDEVLCRVVHVGSTAEAAALFIKVNAARRALVPYDHYQAGLIADEVVPTGIAKTTKAHGFLVEKARPRRFVKGTGNVIYGIGNLTRIVKTYGKGDPSLLGEALSIINALWPYAEFKNSQDRTVGYFIEGIARMVMERTAMGQWPDDRKRILDAIGEFTPADYREAAGRWAAATTSGLNNSNIYLQALNGAINRDNPNPPRGLSSASSDEDEE